MGRKLISRLSFGKREKQVRVWHDARAAPFSDGSMGARQWQRCALLLPLVPHSGLCSFQEDSTHRQHEQLGSTPF